jgi:hypothetical protein
MSPQQPLKFEQELQKLRRSPDLSELPSLTGDQP